MSLEEKNTAEPHWVSVHKLTFNYSAEVITRTRLEGSINVSSACLESVRLPIQYLEETCVGNLVRREKLKPPESEYL